MLYPYLYHFETKEYNAMFHPINMAVLYYSKNISKNEVIKELENVESSSDWFVSDDFRYNDFVNKLLTDNHCHKIEFKTLKMFTTTKCNLDCSYCLIEKNLEKRNVQCRDLSLEDGLSILKKFSEVSLKQPYSKKTIMLYGGEPMLNKENVLKFIQYIRDNEKKGLFNGDVEIILESNGTLITDEISKFLERNNVFIIVSIDGIQSVHDKYRKKKDSSGSYLEAVAGFNTLIKNNCTAVVSSVFTDAYADNISSCIRNMTDTVKPQSIGLNLFHVLEDQDIANDKTNENYLKYIEAFEIAREKGLYIEHIMRRIRPLVDRKLRIKDCGACGNRLVSDVDGNIGICEGLVGNPDYFTKRNDYSELKNDDTFVMWSKRTPFSIKGCEKCPAIGICGAGCVSNAIQQNGDVFSPDNYICGSSKAFIDWALDTWFKDNDIGSVITGGIHILSMSERQSLLGKLEKTFNIPLQTVSKQYEIQG